MATKLSKPVIRETFVDGKPCKVKIDTDLTISFCIKGRKTWFSTSLQACYNMSLIDTVMGAYYEKLKKYNEKKGYSRARKPKRPFIEHVFSSKHITALKAVKKTK